MKRTRSLLLLIILIGGCLMVGSTFNGFGKHPEISINHIHIIIEDIGFGETDKHPEVVEISNTFNHQELDKTTVTI